MAHTMFYDSWTKSAQSYRDHGKAVKMLGDRARLYRSLGYTHPSACGHFQNDGSYEESWANDEGKVRTLALWRMP